MEKFRYYEGNDDDGHWIEGSRSYSSEFRVDKAGTYRLLIHGLGGSGEHGGPAANEHVEVSVYSKVTVSWYFLIPICLALFFALIEPYLRWSFEKRRWAEAGDSSPSGLLDDDD